jgi:Holliday junction resolvasome RuvABC endonuclease subunit
MPTKQSPQSKKTHRIVLGLDPGIGNTGYALVQRFLNGYQLLQSGIIYTSPRAPLGYRLDTHYATIREPE